MAKSPFPGMDPYLESHWRDVHARLVIYVCEALQPRLPVGLKARVEERVYVEGPEGHVRGVYPDVRVVERPASRPASRPAGSAAASAVAEVAEPLVLHIESEPVTETYVEIVEVGSGRRVVTVIEVLSPTNKSPGAGRDLYLEKQREILASSSNLVEIDLTRTGERALFVSWYLIPPSHQTPYIACVRRGARPGVAYIYRAPLACRLPIILVPLRETDPDVPLDIQSVIDRAYESGDYDDIDYRAEPMPPLEPPDATWADSILRAAGRR